jgi:hypothetical protein
MKRRKASKTPQPKLPKTGTAIFDQAKEVRAIARERVGTVKPSKPILPKAARKKPKHKKSPAEDANGS